jgi:four helix bundle protein
MANVIVEKSFDFAVQIVKYARFLKRKREYELAKQIIRSGTSIAANVVESQQAQSAKDFIHKLSIALKETSETILWLKIIYEKSTPLIPILNLILLRKIFTTSLPESFLRRNQSSNNLQLSPSSRWLYLPPLIFNF